MSKAISMQDFKGINYSYFGDGDYYIRNMGKKNDYNVVFIDCDGDDIGILYKNKDNIFVTVLATEFKDEGETIALENALESVYFSEDYPYTNRESLNFMLSKEYIMENDLEDILSQSSFAYKVQDGVFSTNSNFVSMYAFLEFLGRVLLSDIQNGLYHKEKK